MDKEQARLWIVTELFPPDETSTSYILGEIANAMARKYKVGVICGPEVYDKRKKLDKNNIFKLDESIELHRAKGLDVDKNTKIGKAVGLLIMSARLLSISKKYISRGDKVLLVTNPLPLIVLLAGLKMVRDFELSLLVHDIFPENAKPSNVKIPCLSFVKKVFGWAYSKSDRLIAIGRDMEIVLKEKVSTHLSISDKGPVISIIENWADVVNIIPHKYESDSIITIEYAGNIGRGQGLQLFLNNFIQANNTALSFELYGTGAIEDILKQIVKERNLVNVHFHGAYFRSQQNQVLNACHLALVTLADGMYGLGVPSKSYNIMAAGKAILFIGDLNSEIALTIRENNIGFCFDPNDKKELQKFLKNIDGSMIPELETMGENARKLAVNNYSKEVILQKFQNTI